MWGKYTLPIHNLAIGIGILIAYRKKLNEIKYWIPAIVGLVFYLSVILYSYADEDNEKMITQECDEEEAPKKCRKGSAKLMWPFDHSWYGLSYLISLIFLFIYVNPTCSMVTGAVYFSITWMVTGYLGKVDVVGSFWCWSTSFFAPLLILMNYYCTKNMKNIHT